MVGGCRYEFWVLLELKIVNFIYFYFISYFYFYFYLFFYLVNLRQKVSIILDIKSHGLQSHVTVTLSYDIKKNIEYSGKIILYYILIAYNI